MYIIRNEHQQGFTLEEELLEVGLPLGLKVFGPWAHHTEEVGMRY